MATDDKWDVTRGKVYEVEDIDGDGDPHFTDDGGDINWTSRYVVVERVAAQPQTTEQLTAEVEEAKRKLAVAEKQLAEKHAEEAKSEKWGSYSIGDYAKLLDVNGALSGFSIGDFVKITGDASSWGFHHIVVHKGAQRGYCDAPSLSRATKAEYEAQQAKANRLKVGEYAKVVGGGNFETETGDIVVIRCDFGKDYRVNSVDGRELSGFKFAKNLVRATDEEVAEAKRKVEQAEEVAQWAKIGREVGEFHEGDVVVIIANTNFSNNKIGYMGVVGEKSPRTGEYRVDTGIETRVNWTRPNEMKLIAPVESVVNLTVSA